ncbi:hypothetical protein DPMN_161673 [Dreissena polymorpha]|uniref:Uncharacterized protein n=1 Tax=Dreissena polymorpha TaxID=45954 RepID=A0A9D4EPA6_DREPO|nr:hypothetical protein DPMN_161673 [Dreissena polymorpha]
MPITTSQLTIGRQCPKKTDIFDKENSCLIRGVVQSTNGLRTFYRAPSSGKKPNQVKRKSAEKSHTPVKRLVLGTIQSQ